MENQTDDQGSLQITGYHGDIWKDLTTEIQLNFSLVQSYLYGSHEGGVSTGMIGMLHRNEADIAVADFTPTKGRYEVVDFSITLDTYKYYDVVLVFFCWEYPILILPFNRSCLYIKMPTADSNWTTFLNPMSFDSWVVSLIAFVLIPFILAFFYNKWDEITTKLSWPVFITTSSLAQQGLLSTYLSKIVFDMHKKPWKHTCKQFQESQRNLHRFLRG